MAYGRTMIRVLMDQCKWYVVDGKTVVSTELKDLNVHDKNGKIISVPALGGVVEDNIHEVLGYTYGTSHYDNNFKRLPEFMAPYDWSSESANLSLN